MAGLPLHRISLPLTFFFYFSGQLECVISRNSIRSFALLLACGTMDMRKQQLGCKIGVIVHIHCSMSFGIADNVSPCVTNKAANAYIHTRVSQMKTLNTFLNTICCAGVVQSCTTFQHNLPHAQCKSSSAYKVHEFLQKKRILLVVGATTHARRGVPLHQNGTSFLPLLL